MSEIGIAIFGAKAPIGGQSVVETAARRPTDAHATGRRRCHRDNYNGCGHRRTRRRRWRSGRMRPNDQPSLPRTDASKSMIVRGLCQRRRGITSAGVAGNTAAFGIGVDARERPAQLPVIAAVNAAEPAVSRDSIRERTARRTHAAVRFAPAIPALDTDFGAVPGLGMGTRRYTPAPRLLQWLPTKFAS